MQARPPPFLVAVVVLVLATPGLPATAVGAAGLVLKPTPDGGIDIRDGNVLVTHVVLKTPSLRRGQPVLREVTVDGHRLAELRVPIRGTAGEEIWLGEVGGRDKRVVWSGMTGARDADAETSVGLEVTPERVLEYQAAAGVTRCDGVPARLFLRGYDFDTGKFRPVLPPLPAPGAETLTARRGDPGMPSGKPMGGFRFVAASTTRSAGSDARGLASPVELDDDNPATAWSEGLGSDGRGEFVTARASGGGYAVRGLRIFPGDGASLQAFRARNRIRRLQLAFGPAREQRFDVHIPEDAAADAARWKDPYWVPLPKPVPSSCLTVIVTEVTPGSDAAPPKNFGTTAIGDIAIFTEIDGPEAGERLVADLARSPDCGARLPLVTRLGAPAVLPVAQAVLAGKGSARECLVEALTTLEPVPSGPIVLEALTSALAGATEKEERLVTAALVRATAPPISPLTQLLSSATAEADRARAARVLGALDGEPAAAALLAALGQGPPPLRAAVVEALSRARGLKPDAVLAAVAAAPAGNLREADLLRLLPSILGRAPDTRAQALAALRAALGPGRGFEVRARAVMGLGAVGPSGDPAALVDVATHGDHPVLRHLAARELGGWPVGSYDVRTPMRAALDDKDPRVRETAALALGKHGDASANGVLIEAAKQEPWPVVRRAELDALGRLCGPGTGDLMIRAISADVAEVRRAALVSLARCKDPRARITLLRTLARKKEAATIRELSAALIGESGDRSATRLLAEALRRVVVESEGDLALEGVAVAALRALARLGGPDAVDAAATLAMDTRHPFRATAVDALGQLCDPDRGQATLRVLMSGKDAQLAAAAQNAERHCAAQAKP